MKIRWRRRSQWVRGIFWIAAVVAFWRALPAGAQGAYYLEYTYLGEASDGATKPNQEYVTAPYNPTQSAASVPFSAGTTVGRASTSVSGSVAYGTLQFSGSCSVSHGDADGNGIGSEFLGWNGDAAVFSDTLWFVSSSLPDHTPVTIRITTKYWGSLTSGVTTSDNNEYTTSSSIVRLYSPVEEQTGSLGAENATNEISATISSLLTGPYPNPGGSWNDCNFTGTVNLSGTAYDGDGEPFSGSVAGSITSQTYVDVLTPGVTYTSDSGTVYPTLIVSQPVLAIQPATNGVSLSWAVSTPAFRLEQNSDLTTTNWLATTNLANVVTGTNVVTVSPAAGNMFYRLVNP